MSDPIQAQISILHVILGAAIGSGIVGIILGIILNHFLGKRFERFKIDLQKEQTEGQVRFEERHRRQVETLHKSREKLRDLRTCFINAYRVDNERAKLLSVGDLRTAPFREVETAFGDSLIALFSVKTLFDEPFMEKSIKIVDEMIIRFFSVFQQEDLDKQEKCFDKFIKLVNSTMDLVEQKARLVYRFEDGKSGDHNTSEEI